MCRNSTVCSNMKITDNLIFKLLNFAKLSLAIEPFFINRICFSKTTFKIYFILLRPNHLGDRIWFRTIYLKLPHLQAPRLRIHKHSRKAIYTSGYTARDSESVQMVATALSTTLVWRKGMSIGKLSYDRSI